MAIVGIDLGTTNTLVCINQKGKEKCLRFGAMDSEILPSCIYVEDKDEIIVGEEAKDEGVLDPENFISSAKTHIGTDWVKECNGILFSPTDVAAEVLKVVRDKVIEYLELDDDEVIDTVITVPAYFNSKQRTETKKAGLEAGLNVKKIIAEPTAAAVAFIEESEAEDKVFVVDFGGGTFDLSVLEQDEEENYKTCYAPGGNKELGGDNIDDLIVKGIIEWYKEETDIDLTSMETSGISDKSEYLSALAKIRREAVRAKIKLSKKNEAEISIANFARINGKYEDFDIILSKERMEEWCSPIFTEIDRLIKKYIEEHDIDVDEIEDIVLVGGSCYIPKVKEIVENIFGKKTNTSMDLSTMVAKGACIVANSLDGVTTSEFIDVVAHSLGVEVKGRQFKKMLSRGTRIGKGETYAVSEVFTTTSNNQDSIAVNVFETADDENERNVTKLTPYGRFVMNGITHAPKGQASIEIKFEYDDNGCLVVTSTDLQSGQSKQVEMHGEVWDEPEIDSSVVSIDFVLLLDVSDSMNEKDCSFNGIIETRLASAKRACTKLISEMIDFNTHKMGIVTFGSDAEIISNLSNNQKILNSEIDRIPSADGVTVLAEALKEGNNMFQSSENEKVIIVVTDGVPIPSKKFDHSLYELVCVNVANKIKADGVRIVVIGVGVNDNAKELMARIASSKFGNIDFYSIDNMSQLTETFATVIRDIVVKGV